MCDGTFSHHCSKKSISTTCGIPQCGTYSKKSKSTTSFYVVLVPHGIGEMVLIALTRLGGCDHMYLQVRGICLAVYLDFRHRDEFHIG